MAVKKSLAVPVHILPIIVLSQFAGTSVWFAGNAILPALQSLYHFPDDMLSNITIAVQLGFIMGTLSFALLTIADRFSPVKVFMLSALLAAMFNYLLLFTEGNISLILSLRFLTGFFLAGVYPVGMKIAADWYASNLGKALGFLVGALVAGKAVPHLLKGLGDISMWKQVIIYTSCIAATGGIMVGLLLKNGPHRTKAKGLSFSNLPALFHRRDFKAAAFGYFGHMWELYTFWAFVPVMLNWYNLHQTVNLNVSLWSFLIIGVGTISCIIGGYFSRRLGSAKVAFVSLSGSGICCILSPLFFLLPQPFFLTAMILWGCLVIADSPQFSALVSQTADNSQKGTALTLVTCIGFAITIISIEIMSYIFMTDQPIIPWLNTNKTVCFMMMSLGPLFGLISMRSLLKKKTT
jgi:MFS family permease